MVFRLLILGLSMMAAAGAAERPLPEFEKLRGSFEDAAEGWKSLLNRKDLTGWHAQDYKDRPARPWDWNYPVSVGLDPASDEKLTGKTTTADDAGAGYLNNREGNSSNLVSDETFADLEVYVEFAVPRGSNAGVCLMGNYEIQIFDSYGKDVSELNYRDNGGIYGFPAKGHRDGGAPPRVNASRAPGEWQSFHIWFRAPRYDAAGKKLENARFLRVEHNGVEIHGEYDLPRPTRAVSPWPEAAKAPLLLQGDHGPAAFRNVYVRTLRNMP